MPATKEQLLAEIEELVRTAPTTINAMRSSFDWLGRFNAVIRAWDPSRSSELIAASTNLQNSLSAHEGFQAVSTLLHEARHSLRMETVGPLSVAIASGQVFDYFDEVRRVIEGAKKDILFIDPYLDAEFVARYLGHVSKGVVIRLLAREKLSMLLPAVEAFAKQEQFLIEVRSAPSFHDRYVFVDRISCYQSGASFKDGAKRAPTTLTEITDAFKAMSQTYEEIWARAKVEL
jgi:hypothetical protein